MDAEFIKSLRKRLNMTQTEFATELGVDIKTIRNWEKGGTIPKTKEVMITNLERSISAQPSDANIQVNHGNGVNVHGCGNIIPSATMMELESAKEKIAMLERLLEEKERTIRILLER